MTRSAPVLLIVALLSCTGCESYSVHSFRSDDAVIMYCGFWSTPRYRIPFEEMAVTGTSCEATFAFTNPPDNVGLWVELNFYDEEDVSALVDVGARASVQIMDAAGQLVLEFEGPLNGSYLPSDGTWSRHGMAIMPPTKVRFRDLGQVLKRSMFSKDGQPSEDKWGYGRGNNSISHMAWGAWAELAKGSYSITFTITAVEPPSRPIRLIPMLTGGSRGVL